MTPHPPQSVLWGGSFFSGTKRHPGMTHPHKKKSIFVGSPPPRDPTGWSHPTSHRNFFSCLSLTDVPKSECNSCLKVNCGEGFAWTRKRFRHFASPQPHTHNRISNGRVGFFSHFCFFVFISRVYSFVRIFFLVQRSSVVLRQKNTGLFYFLPRERTTLELVLPVF